MARSEVVQSEQGRFRVFPAEDLFAGDASNAVEKHTGSMILTDDELVCGSAGSRFYRSVDLDDALQNEGTRRVPLDEIERLALLSGTGEHVVAVDAPSLGEHAIGFQLGTRSKNMGRSERDARAFVEAIQSAARDHGTDVDIEEGTITSGALPTIVGGGFFGLVGLFLLLMGLATARPVWMLIGLGGGGMGLWFLVSGLRRRRADDD